MDVLFSDASKKSFTRFFGVSSLVEKFTGWVYACIIKNAQGVSSVPIRLFAKEREDSKVLDIYHPSPVEEREISRFRKMPDPVVRQAASSPGDVVEIFSHPFLDLLTNPNPIDSGFDLLEITVTSLDLFGDAFWLINFDKAGLPKELWPIPTPLVKVVRGKYSPINSYEIGWGRDKKVYKPHRIVHFRYPSPFDKVASMAPLSAADQAAIIERLMFEYNRSLLENDARPDFFILAQRNLTPDEYEAFLKRWIARYRGPGNKGIPAILEGGLDVKPLGFSPRELMAPNYMKEVKALICAIFNVPLPLVEMTSMARASAETAEYSHQKHGILPRCNKIQAAINQQLAPFFDKEGRLFVAFSDPVTEDELTQAQIRQINLSSDFTVPNEERKRAGLPPVDEDWANMPASLRRPGG